MMRVIGAMGLVSPDSTPAYVEAIVVDQHGDLAEATADGFVSGGIPFDAERSAYVPLPSGMPLDPNRYALLLSARDVHAIGDVQAPTAISAAAREALEWLRNPTNDAIARGFAWLPGNYAALLVTQETWSHLRRLLVLAATRDLTAALGSDDPTVLPELAWRLQRAARGDVEGMALAAFAFERAGRPDLSEFMRAMSPVPDEEWANAFTSASQVGLSKPALIVHNGAQVLRHRGEQWKKLTAVREAA